MNVFSQARSACIDEVARELEVAPGASPCCHAPIQKRVDRKGCEHWTCAGCGEGGSALDFAMAVRHWPVAQAARWIVQRVLCGPQQPASDAVTKVAECLRASAYRDSRVDAYLLTQGVPEVTVQRAMEQGWLCQLPGEATDAADYLAITVGPELLGAAGIGQGDAVSALAYRPLVFVTADSCQLAAHSITGDHPVQYGQYSQPVVASLGQPERALVLGSEMELLRRSALMSDVLLVGLHDRVWRPEWAATLSSRFDVDLWQIDVPNERIIDDCTSAGLWANALA